MDARAAAALPCRTSVCKYSPRRSALRSLGAMPSNARSISVSASRSVVAEAPSTQVTSHCRPPPVVAFGGRATVSGSVSTPIVACIAHAAQK